MCCLPLNIEIFYQEKKLEFAKNEKKWKFFLLKSCMLKTKMIFLPFNSNHINVECTTTNYIDMKTYNCTIKKLTNLIGLGHVITPGHVITNLPFKHDGYFVADGNKTGQQESRQTGLTVNGGIIYNKHDI